MASPNALAEAVGERLASFGQWYAIDDHWQQIRTTLPEHAYACGYCRDDALWLGSSVFCPLCGRQGINALTVAYPALRRINDDGRWEACQSRYGSDAEMAAETARNINEALSHGGRFNGDRRDRVRIVNADEGARPKGLPVVVCNAMYWPNGGVGFFYYLCA